MDQLIPVIYEYDAVSMRRTDAVSTAGLAGLVRQSRPLPGSQRAGAAANMINNLVSDVALYPSSLPSSLPLP